MLGIGLILGILRLKTLLLRLMLLVLLLGLLSLKPLPTAARA